MTRWKRCWLAAGFAAALPSCGAEIAELQAELSRVRFELRAIRKEQEKQRAEMEDGFRVALCRPEIRQLLEDVSRECSPITIGPPGSQPQIGVCNTKKIAPAVISADPEHKGRFLKFMTFLRHEAFYMRSGATQVVRERRDRLEKLATQPLLRKTRFLIVSHPAHGEPDREAEAMNRAKAIATLMAQYNSEITDEHRSIWIYEFPVSKLEIDLAIDRPVAGEPSDLSRSVWVFRADC